MVLATQTAIAEVAEESPELTDHDLISAHKEGNKDAFSLLVKKYESRVFNHCFRMVNDREESADLTQEVFLKVYRNIGNYEHTYSFYTWLYRITVNCCIDYIRKRKRQLQSVSLSFSSPEESGSGKEQDVPDITYTPDRHMRDHEISKMLHVAIDKLSEKMRTIILLKEIEGFSYEEIADILNCSRGTVKSRLFRARERLRELLEPQMVV